MTVRQLRRMRIVFETIYGFIGFTVGMLLLLAYGMGIFQGMIAEAKHRGWQEGYHAFEQLKKSPPEGGRNRE